MKNDKQTREKLIESAKAEFLEKGYMKASLRKICANAGVTTGALYFFFEDKEDLFAELVMPLIHLISNEITQHIAEDEAAMSSPGFLQTYLYEDNSSEEQMAENIIHILYENSDAVELIIEKSQGTRFENLVDNIIENIEKNYIFMTEKIVANNPAFSYDSQMLHWFIHTMVNAFIHFFTHEKDEEQAKQHIRFIMKFMINGWMDMIFIPKNE